MAYQQFYKGFLTANANKQHYACHSHYFWPDCTRDAMLQYWDDSAKYVDHKWTYFFETLVPELQQRISAILNTQAPQQIVFAPNTHELVFRILSCFNPKKVTTVVSTDSEFHSFQRQASRLQEEGTINLITVPTQPFCSFNERFKNAIATHNPDLVFFSHVFFNSGYVVQDVNDIVNSVTNDKAVIAIDGYHGFMAKPLDISGIADRVFYLAGGYKYAQAGEGACFAHVPVGCKLRPTYTGWFAEFGALDKPRQQAGKEVVQYSIDGMRFAGATMDFTALYRLRAVLRLFEENGLTVKAINHHVMQLQDYFLETLFELQHSPLTPEQLVVKDPSHRGHFLTFELESADATKALAMALEARNILTDFRGNRLRFGFGLYHTRDYIDLSLLHDL
ncbi:aminotransferase class V-fold PLP-dependent enzyme [Alteromonas sp. D210916BOD_24]|uniref:aminotransferase class V-fold PLP-dependent enzyme n=1 Tax=Alteromonas sp. D210916BOD_24 TaxID=3157618 RepID=UPI00399C6112